MEKNKGGDEDTTIHTDFVKERVTVGSRSTYLFNERLEARWTTGRDDAKQKKIDILKIAIYAKIISVSLFIISRFLFIRRFIAGIDISQMHSEMQI